LVNMPSYEKFCKKFLKKFSWRKKNIHVSQEFIDSLNFTGIDLEPDEIITFSYIMAIISLIAGVAISIAILSFYNFSFREIGMLTILLIFLIIFAFPLIVLHYTSEYPKIKAKYMKIHSLGDVPEVISYIVMYLRIHPNLERALEFASSESRTALSRDLRKLLWDIEIRIYKGIDDAITSFAELWGKWSDYFKRAIHLIRSSVREKETERYVTLNRALDVVLDGTKDTMINFANKLNQPTLVIYSIGVMLPLALVAMLPAASITRLHISIFQIFIIYDILLPIILFVYIRKILLMRPATFNPPSIPSNVVRINKFANASISLAILISFSFLALYFSYSILFIIGIGFSISYYGMSYFPYKKIRDEIKEMENEFSDALYIIGKRVEEGKPPEEAFYYASETMKGSKIGKVFSNSYYNLMARRTTLKEALFNKEYGSLRNIFSDRIRAIMKIFVEGARKSHKATGNAIIKIADHLKQLQDVERNIKNNLGVLTSTLHSTATIFAPMIAGITLGITKLITNVLSGMNFSISESMSILIFGNEKFSLAKISYDYFILTIGIYILLLVMLLLRFANGIDEGDDYIEYMYSIGREMPLATIIFALSTILSSLFFATL